MTNVAIALTPYPGGRVLPGQDDLPTEDGEPMETGFHDAQDALLKDSLLDAWRERRDFFVAGNMFVYFSEQQIKANDFRGPDVFVVLDVDPKGRKCWVAWEEGGKLPDVVIEITSASTAHVDRGEKMQIYSRIWRTAAYFVFDPDTERLEGFALDAQRRVYVPIQPDERGDLFVAPLELKLGLRSTHFWHYQQLFVRWLDRDGNVLPTAKERADSERSRADSERSRADSERSRADELERRVKELEERLR